LLAGAALRAPVGTTHLTVTESPPRYSEAARESVLADGVCGHRKRAGPQAS